MLKNLISRIFKKNSSPNTSSASNNLPILPTSQLSSIQLLPIELFLIICTYLTPEDLYYLCSVCKSFRVTLWSASPKTQRIWEQTRKTNKNKYFYYLPPPINMLEQEYVWRTTMANKHRCQYCSKPLNMMYYDLYTTNIVCCEGCIGKYGIIKHRSHKNKKLPKKFEDAIIPTRHFRLHPDNYKLFWVKDIKLIKNQYYSLKKKERKLWLEERRKEVSSYLEKIDEYIQQDEIRVFNNNKHTLLFYR